VRAEIERAYLAAETPYGQSGVSGDAARWERNRRPICNAIDHDGDLLDVGFANGLLMETLPSWAAEDGHRIEPYGLDYPAPIATLARRRLPNWADRIWIGNAVDWVPPRRFDYVRTELDYVPPDRAAGLFARLLDDFLVPGGRLIVCSYGSSHPGAHRVEPIEDYLRRWGHAVAGEIEAAADGDGPDAPRSSIPTVRVVWVDRP
jgi:hypothetical protein